MLLSVLGTIDDALRKSLPMRFLPLLKRHPRLYRSVQRLRNLLLPRTSPHGLDRYQLRAVERFLRFTSPDLASYDLLELGSDREGKTLREFRRRGVRSATGVNPDLRIWDKHPTGVLDLEPGCRLIQRDARDTGLSDESVDGIFSVATFEHIHELDRALREMFRVLRPGGFVYADFNPIWSSSVGHHVYAEVDGEEARHWKPETNPVPDHGHLLNSAEELEAKLRGRISDKLLAAVIEWIYRGDGINRVFYEDYVRMFDSSPFEVVHFETVEEHVDAKTMASLRAKYPGYERFDVRGVETLLRKPK